MDPHVLRSEFLSFFEARDHTVVASSPVIPKGDPTLLFANAGMNQFKDVFLGNEVRDYKRAASAQKCIRAGGKHNDLDEVGKDGTHLTLFEMLGNWSFGDYYKRESLSWGWTFLTETLHMDPERLFVTVYKDDDESWDIWTKEIGVPEERMLRLGNIEEGDEENFWSMGPIGPCGPCSEIHYDVAPSRTDGWEAPEPDGTRFLEIWNHVFMEFDRDEDGVLTPLPMKSVDTGAGFERLCVVLQNVDSVYATTLFKPILEKTAELLGSPMSQAEILKHPEVSAYRVIADHVRSLTFAVSEGQPLSNEGRGYVLRRILRRAVRFGRKLGYREPFLHRVSQAVVDEFGGAYPEIVAVAAQTQEVIRLEEERFFRTLDRGIARFEQVAEKSRKAGRIAGVDAFTLYDTFGFPLDLTEIMAEEHQLSVDTDGFQVALQEQRERSAEASRFYVDEAGPWEIVREGSADTFLGYTRTDSASLVIRYRPRGDFYELLLDMTPFYAESGGQVGDTGTIVAEDGTLHFEVLDTQRTDAGIVHFCRLDDGFVTAESMAKDVIAAVDTQRRALISANHTATHLLHTALRSIVSGDAHQAGSLVRGDKLRFDFTLSRALTKSELLAVETAVNTLIREGHEVRKHIDVPQETAVAWGAMAIFGEKYGARVRVVEVPGLSMELCGGIHVENTRDILFFRITQETAIAAGTRRIEAVTNEGATRLARLDREQLEDAMRAARVDTPAQLSARIDTLNDELAETRRDAESLARRTALAEIAKIQAEEKNIDGISVCASRVDVRDRNQLLMYADLLRDRMRDGVALLGAEIGGKPALVCMVADQTFKARKLKAGDLVNDCASLVGGRGGGRPTLAQAGGNDVAQLDEAIRAIYVAVEKRLA